MSLVREAHQLAQPCIWVQTELLNDGCFCTRLHCRLWSVPGGVLDALLEGA